MLKNHSQQNCKCWDKKKKRTHKKTNPRGKSSATVHGGCAGSLPTPSAPRGSAFLRARPQENRPSRAGALQAGLRPDETPRPCECGLGVEAQRSCASCSYRVKRCCITTNAKGTMKRQDFQCKENAVAHFYSLTRAEITGDAPGPWRLLTRGSWSERPAFTPKHGVFWLRAQAAWGLRNSFLSSGMNGHWDAEAW